MQVEKIEEFFGVIDFEEDRDIFDDQRKDQFDLDIVGVFRNVVYFFDDRLFDVDFRQFDFFYFIVFLDQIVYC